MKHRGFFTLSYESLKQFLMLPVEAEVVGIESSQEMMMLEVAKVYVEHPSLPVVREGEIPGPVRAEFFEPSVNATKQLVNMLKVMVAESRQSAWGSRQECCYCKVYSNGLGMINHREDCPVPGASMLLNRLGIFEFHSEAEKGQ